MISPPPLPAIIPQIQVCLQCNQNCTYCFQEHHGHIIPLDTVAAILSKVVRYNHDKNPPHEATKQAVYWHGGEPLLAGVDFFQAVVGLQAEYPDIHFENRVQTNGTLLTKEFADFFAKHNFDVGFSLDGPAHLHNRYRQYGKTRTNRATFDDVLKGIESYRKAKQIDKVPLICVITRESTKHPKEIFDFFKELQASVQLDIYDIRAGNLCAENDDSSLLFELAPQEDELSDFLMELFDLWFHDTSSRVDFKELRNEVKMVLQPTLDLGEPYDKRRCDIRRTIFDPDGNVFSCDQYINDSRTKLGNIEVDDLDQMITAKLLLWEEIKHHIRHESGQMTCSSCEWGRRCSGGCITCMKYNDRLAKARKSGMADRDWAAMKNSRDLKSVSGEFYYCNALRTLRTHIKQTVAPLLAERDVSRKTA